MGNDQPRANTVCTRSLGETGVEENTLTRRGGIAVDVHIVHVNRLVELKDDGVDAAVNRLSARKNTTHKPSSFLQYR